MAITKEKAIDILDKIDFFQGQRAGRELWNEKSRYVQEIDLKAFQEDVASLREYIADVVPKSEVAREIISEIKSFFDKHTFWVKPKPSIDTLHINQVKEYHLSDYETNKFLYGLKKKYTEGEK